MITFPLIALFVTALFFAAIPVVLFALMVETCSKRASTVARKSVEEAPVTLRFPLRAAA
jgi:hypothetical protein